LGIPQRFRRITSGIAEKLIPTSYLENEVAEWMLYLIDALNGEFEDTDAAIADATEELQRYNQTLARRKGGTVYTVKYRYFNDAENKAKSIEGSMSLFGGPMDLKEEAIAKIEQEHPGLVIMECVVM